MIISNFYVLDDNISKKKLPQFKKMKLPISYKINAYLGKQWEENLGNLKGKKITSKIICNNNRANFF